MANAPDYSVVPPQFWTKHQGRDFILYAGLLDAAHRKYGGISKIEITPLERPTAENNFTAETFARITFQDGQVFEETGDANSTSVGRMIVPHIRRMANTRAKARALRDAINIGTAAFEELGEPDSEEFKENVAAVKSTKAVKAPYTTAQNTVASTPSLDSDTTKKILAGQAMLVELGGEFRANPAVVPSVINTAESASEYLQKLATAIRTLQAKAAGADPVTGEVLSTKTEEVPLGVATTPLEVVSAPTVDSIIPDQVSRLSKARSLLTKTGLVNTDGTFERPGVSTDIADISWDASTYENGTELENTLQILTQLHLDSRTKSRKSAA